MDHAPPFAAGQPQIVGDQDWNLSNKQANLARSKDILKYNPEILEQFPAANLVRLAGNVGEQYAVISTIDNMLEYYMHYEINDMLHLGKCATQIKIWRSLNASVQGLAKKVFDDYLLKFFDTIVSDQYQTGRGREFWEVQMSSHIHSHTIGLLTLNDIKIYDRKIKIKDWLTSVDGWGSEAAYRYMRFFISNLSAAQILA